MTKLVVVNASPSILLHKAELEWVLPSLFERVVVPAGVLVEIAAQPSDRIAERIRQNPKIEIATAGALPEVIVRDLGNGESEVLSFALQNPGFVPVLNDSEARLCALSLGLPTLGTGAILVLAKRGGLIPLVRPALDRLRREGLWISNEVVELICRKAGEAEPPSTGR